MANVVLQNETEPQEGIFEFVNPQDVDTEDWLANHMDCDAIIDDYGDHMTIYAYTRDPIYNYALSQYRNERHSNHLILRGISSDVLSGIF